MPRLQESGYKRDKSRETLLRVVANARPRFLWVFLGTPRVPKNTQGNYLH